MSNSAQTADVRKVKRSSAIPKAIIHKKILDAAKQEPDATINELATTVNGASDNLVEHVLDEYGDPAETQPSHDSDTDKSTLTDTSSTEDTEAGHDHESNVSENANTSEESSNGNTDVSGSNTTDLTAVGSTNVADANTANEADINSSEKVSVGIQEKDGTQGEPVPPFEELTKKQKETIHAIFEDPEATQKELAERFGVTSATICERVNNIRGFDWERRKTFATNMVENMAENGAHADESVEVVQNDIDQLDELHQRIQTLERDLEERSPISCRFSDSNLLHKVIHACVHSEHISEEEELKILQCLTGDQTASE